MVIRKTYQIFLLREKGNFGASRNILLRATYYETVRHRTLMHFKQTKETKMEIRTQIMVRKFPRRMERDKPEEKN